MSTDPDVETLAETIKTDPEARDEIVGAIVDNMNVDDSTPEGAGVKSRRREVLKALGLAGTAAVAGGAAQQAMTEPASAAHGSGTIGAAGDPLDTAYVTSISGDGDDVSVGPSINNVVHAEPGDDLASKASAADGGKLVLEEGSYTGTTLDVSDLDLVIEGAGKGKTVLNFGVKQVNASLQQGTLTLRDLTLTSDGTGTGVEIANLERTTLLENVEIDNFDIGVQASDSLLTDYFGAHIKNNRIGVLFDKTATNLAYSGDVTTHHFYGGEIFSNSDHNVKGVANVARNKFFGVTIHSGSGSTATGMIHGQGVSGSGAPNNWEFIGCDFEIYDTGRTLFASSGDAFHQTIGWSVIGGSVHSGNDFTLADITDDKEWTIDGFVFQSPSSTTATININGSGSVRHRFEDIRSVNSATININFNADNGVIVKRVDDVVTENDGTESGAVAVGSGDATGDTTVTVSHGLDVTPDAEDINAVLTNATATGYDAHVKEVRNIGATSFDVVVNIEGLAGTTGETVDLSWSVDASEGL